MTPRAVNWWIDLFGDQLFVTGAGRVAHDGHFIFRSQMFLRRIMTV